MYKLNYFILILRSYPYNDIIRYPYCNTVSMYIMNITNLVGHNITKENGFHPQFASLPDWIEKKKNYTIYFWRNKLSSNNPRQHTEVTIQPYKINKLKAKLSLPTKFNCCRKIQIKLDIHTFCFIFILWWSWRFSFKEFGILNIFMYL